MEEQKKLTITDESVNENKAGVTEAEEELSLEEVTGRTLSPGRLVLKRFFRSKLSMTGLIILLILFLFSFVGPLFDFLPFVWGEKEADESRTVKEEYSTEVSAPTYGDEPVYIVTYSEPSNYLKPSDVHWLGTDDKGFDVFSRLMYGGRISLTVGFVVVILETIIGIILGGIAGYFGKWIDQVIMRVVDIFNCVPTMPMLMIVGVALDAQDVAGPTKLYTMMAMLTLFGWAGTARLVRGQILSLREQDFMISAEASGLPITRKIFKHLIPNVMPQLIVSMTLGLGGIILTEATLGYLGIGLPAEYATWGNMINAAANNTALRLYPNLWISPGICIVLAVLAFNFVGDGLRDAFDPKARRQTMAKNTDTKNQHYITAKESRDIAKENTRTIRALQKKRASYKREDYLTQMRDEKNVVEFEDLHTYFFTDNGVVKAVNGVSFDIPQGSTVGVVGESGCGKSVTSLSLMQLVQGPMGQIVSGSIRFRSTVRKAVGTEPLMVQQRDENGNLVTDENGEPVMVQALNKRGKPRYKKVFEEHEETYDVAKMPISEMSSIRGREIAMIFQEPMTSLNPVFTIGKQLDEVTLLHVDGADKEMAKEKSIEMLKLVGIAMPEHVYKSYPHQLSGGMRQRVMIAMALCCNPKLIIADEPTTALDVTIQAQILDLLRDVKDKISGSIMLITHDLGVIAEMVDYVVVMYAGRVVEKGTVQEIFKNPLHPYTIGLQKSKPVVGKKVDRLYSIPGNVPNPINMLSTCYFKDRCSQKCEKCNQDYPEMIQVSPTHFVACHLLDKDDYKE